MAAEKREGKKKKIAVFATGWCCEILGQFLMGMTAYLADKETDLFLFLCYPLLAESAASRHGQLNIFNLPDLKDFDGVVIFGSSINYDDVLQKLFKRCEKLDVPVIVQGMTHDRFYTLTSDNYHATRKLCEHLLDEHHVKDLIFFAGSANSYDSMIRLQAIEDVLKERGAEDMLREVFCTEWENARVETYIEEHVAAGWKLPGAIVCANDGLAMQTCVSMSAHGYTVPDDVMVTGFDRIDESQVFYPAISSVDQLFENSGRICAELWLDVLNGKKREKDVRTPCEFVAAESCGCTCNNDGIRRDAGRAAFYSRTQNNYFSRKLNAIDNTILGAVSYADFRNHLHAMYTGDHNYEGNSFHFMLGDEFGQSLYDTTIRMKTTGYSDRMDVIYSTEDGAAFEKEIFPSRELIPGYTGEGPCHLYIFLPVHAGKDAYGYAVFRDHVDKVYNHVLQTYQDRLSMAVEKFRHTLRLNLLNEQLMDLTTRDTLTNVKNRTAYSAKEEKLLAEIGYGRSVEFAIVMFDVNNLKTVNDTLGHDAGDDYIIRCCRLICRTYAHSPIYRMGGDEFLAVLTGDDYRIHDELIARFKEHMEKVKDKDPTDADYVSVACGLAVYDPSTDKTVDDVLKRADSEMYRNKREMKGSNNRAFLLRIE